MCTDIFRCLLFAIFRRFILPKRCLCQPEKIILERALVFYDVGSRVGVLEWRGGAAKDYYKFLSAKLLN